MINAIAAAQNSQNPRTENLARQADKNGSYMQMEDFLQLLTSQISNQDPLEPMKDTEFISQMANIASLEQMQQFTQGFESFADSQKDMVAQAYLGRMVSISEQGSEVSGLVESVEKSEDGTISVIVSGKNYDPQSITRVSLPRNDPFATQWNHYVEKPFSRASGFGQQHRQRQFPRLQVFPGKLFGQFLFAYE